MKRKDMVTILINTWKYLKSLTQSFPLQKDYNDWRVRLIDTHNALTKDPCGGDDRILAGFHLTVPGGPQWELLNRYYGKTKYEIWCKKSPYKLQCKKNRLIGTVCFCWHAVFSCRAVFSVI